MAEHLKKTEKEIFISQIQSEIVRRFCQNSSALAKAVRLDIIQHEYRPMNSIMTLLKPLNNPNLLIPYELHPNPLPRRQTYSGTKPRRNKPTISNCH